MDFTDGSTTVNICSKRLLPGIKFPCIQVLHIPKVTLFSSKMHGCLAQHIFGRHVDFATLQKLSQSLQVTLLCRNMKWSIEQDVRSRKEFLSLRARTYNNVLV